MEELFLSRFVQNDGCKLNICGHMRTAHGAGGGGGGCSPLDFFQIAI